MSDPSSDYRNFPIPVESHPARNAVVPPAPEHLALALTARETSPPIAAAVTAFETALDALAAAEEARTVAFDAYRTAPAASRAAILAAATSPSGKPPKSPDLDALSDAAIFQTAKCDVARTAAGKAASNLDAIVVEHASAVAETARASLPAIVTRWSETVDALSIARSEADSAFGVMRTAELLAAKASGKHHPEHLYDAFAAIGFRAARPPGTPHPDEGFACVGYEYRYVLGEGVPPLEETLAEYAAIRARGGRIRVPG